MAKRKTDPRQKIREFLKGPPKRTQTWLAGEVGMTVSGLNDIVTGRRRPSLTVASKLEKLVGIPPRDFAGAA